LKHYKGFKKVDIYIAKVWSVEQRYHHPAPDVSREELEQYEIDRERLRDLYESYKIVERVLDEKEERRDGELVSMFFCKWTSKLCSPFPLTLRPSVHRVHLGKYANRFCSD
jgi:chromodomain-helicase-DNA-binding protein 1